MKRWNLLFLIVISGLVFGCSSKKDDDGEVSGKLVHLGKIGGTLSLFTGEAPDDQGNFTNLTSVYSFTYTLRGDEDTIGQASNQWDLQLRSDMGTDYFFTSLARNQIGSIVDLGQKNCDAITATAPTPAAEGEVLVLDRLKDPTTWFTHSEAMAELRANGASQVEVNKGHCYALFNTGESIKVFATFYVLDHAAGQSVQLSNRELFQRSGIFVNPGRIENSRTSATQSEARASKEMNRDMDEGESRGN